MLPILLTIGPIKIYSFGFLLAIGFFLAAFIIWRRLKELGLKEEKVLDFIISGWLIGLILSRFFYILENYRNFSFSFQRWFLFTRYPGLSLWGFYLGIFIALFWLTKKEKINFWKVSDEVIYGLLPFSLLFQIGQFFDGSSFGKITSSPWGVYLPGMLIRQQPVSLFGAVLILILWLLLLHWERSWRIWPWYKSHESGLVSLMAIGVLFLIIFLLAFLENLPLYFYWAEIFLSLAGLISVAIIIWQKSQAK